MKRLFTLILTFSLLFLAFPQAINAETQCCQPGCFIPPNWTTCSCSGASVPFSCSEETSCNVEENICQSKDIIPTPVPSEADCGGTSEPCCPNNTCQSGRTCEITYAGNRCVDQAQKEALSGGWTKNKNSVLCPDGKSVNTALGCIGVSSGNDLITSVLRLATGVGGGIALALILYGVFVVTTSAGIPDKLKAGGEIITSAIIGLIFILLSVVLVNLIGINILGIPGLS